MQGLSSAAKTMIVKLKNRVGLVPSSLRPYRNQPGFSVVVTKQRVVAARLVAAAEPWRFSAKLARRIQAVLDTADIDYWSVQPRSTRITQWSVRAEDFPDALDAIVAALSGTGHYLRTAGAAPVLIDDAARASIPSGDGAVDIFQYTLIDGRVSASQTRCQLLPWTASERGTVRTTNRTAVVQEILDVRPLGQAALTCWDGSVQPRPEAAAETDAAEIDFPVDAVYLWVNDSDPAWRARRDAAYREHFGHDRADSQAKASIRYRDRGELQASMRSLEMYAPWIRNVYLVTDQQRPDWLDPASTRVTVVDHREIFTDPSTLPTFNSHVLGTQLHHIPGLSEYFLLMNDDVLFSRAVSPYDFFTPSGQLKVTLSRSRRPLLAEEKLTSLEQARVNSARLLEQQFGRQVTRLFAHVPVPQSISLATEISQRYGAEIAQTLAHPFRSADDYVISSWLGLYTALFTGRGVMSDVGFAYFDVGNSAARKRMSSPARYRNASVICVNDTDTQDTEASSRWLTAWLGRTYPVPTPYELLGEAEAAASQRLGSG